MLAHCLTFFFEELKSVCRKKSQDLGKDPVKQDSSSNLHNQLHITEEAKARTEAGSYVLVMLLEHASFYSCGKEVLIVLKIMKSGMESTSFSIPPSLAPHSFPLLSGSEADV